MSLLSRYYVKQNIQNRLIEENNLDENIFEEGPDSIFREVSYIKDNLMVVEEKVSAVVTGFFDNAGYCL